MIKQIILFFLIIFVSIFFLGCKKYSFFSKVDTSHFDKSLKKDYKDQCDTAYQYIKKLVYSYQKTCREYTLNPKFYDSVTFMRKKLISADYYFSSTREALIYVFKSNNNKLTIYGSNFPVQFYILQNLRSLPMEIDDIKFPRFLNVYDNARGAMNFQNSSGIEIYGAPPNDSVDYGFLLEGSFKIIGYLSKDSYIMIRGVDARGHNVKNKNIVNDVIFSVNGMAIIFGSNNIDGMSEYGTWIGKSLATSDLQQLFFRSEYFREVLANDRLAATAREMVIKKEHAEKNADFKYDFIEFLHDKKILQQRIDSFKIKLTADDLFENVKTQIKSGTLFWFYSSYRGFVIQWTLINIICTILILMIVHFRLFQKNLGPKFTKGGVLGIAIAMNTYCFLRIPEGMEVQYWFPLLFVLLIYVILYKIKKEKTLGSGSV